MIQYLLTSTITATMLLVVYQLFLEKEKMHQFNRFYLLTSLLFSLIIPFISIEVIEEITTPMNAPIPMSFSGGSMVIAEETNYLEQTLWGIYVLVTAILLFRFTRNIITFYQLKKNNATLSFQNATLVLLQEPILPHTFMNSIFINEAEYQERKIEKELFAHEMTHVNQKHTLDVLFVELIKTVFWFNPLFILYKKAIQLNHEFLADEKVVQSYQNIPFYQSLLLSKASCNPPLYLASNLNFQVTKKRFLMMSRNSSKIMIVGKQVLLVPVFTLLFCFFCIHSVGQSPVKKQYSKANAIKSTPKRNVKKNNLLKKRSIKIDTAIEKKSVTTQSKNKFHNIGEVSETPEFPGGMEKFYQFVGKNYNLPKDFKGDGKIYIKFIIEMDGSITNEEILRDMGFGTGEEAIRVLKLSPKWIPAKKDGVPVRVQYSLPITLQQG